MRNASAHWFNIDMSSGSVVTPLKADPTNDVPGVTTGNASASNVYGSNIKMIMTHPPNSINRPTLDKHRERFIELELEQESDHNKVVISAKRNMRYARQDRTRQERTGQDSTGQDRTGHDWKIRPYKT